MESCKGSLFFFVMAKVLGFYAAVFLCFFWWAAYLGLLPWHSGAIPGTWETVPVQYLRYHSQHLQKCSSAPASRPPAVAFRAPARRPPSTHRRPPAPTGAHQRPPDAHQTPTSAHLGKVVPPWRVVISHCCLWWLKSFWLLYCHLSLLLFVGGYLDLVLWKLVFFNCGHGDINSGCASTMEGISPNLVGEMDVQWRVVRGHCFVWRLKFWDSILPCFLCFFW